MRALREEHGVDRRALEEASGICLSNIEHLEAGEMDAIRAPAIVRGYLKCYSRALNAAPSEFLARYDAIHGAEARPNKAPAGKESAPPGKRAWIKISLGAAAVVIAICLLLVMPVESMVLVGKPANKAITAGSVETSAVGEELSILVTEEGWLDVVDASGNILCADFVRKNAQLILDGEAPFRVTVKEAAAVSLNYQALSIHLDSDSGDNTALLGN
ncbi:MAG: RodZ domain-containing protein [bacterium]